MVQKVESGCDWRLGCFFYETSAASAGESAGVTTAGVGDGIERQ